MSDVKCLGPFKQVAFLGKCFRVRRSKHVQTVLEYYNFAKLAIWKPAIQPNACFKVVVHLLGVMQVDLSTPHRAPWAGAEDGERLSPADLCWRLSTLCIDGRRVWGQPCMSELDLRSWNRWGVPRLLYICQCTDLSENQSLSILFWAQKWIYKPTLARRN